MLDTVPLKLKSSECKNIIQAVNQARSVNEVIMEYLPEMIDCAKEKIQFVEISSLRQSVLISFENMIGSVLSVEPVPFGLVTVHGSGASKDHQEDQFQTLAYTLIETPVDNIEDAAFHLTRTHGHSEQTVPINPNYGFKTFGGATLAMMLVPFPSNPQFRVDLQVLTGDAFRQDDKKMISSVYLNDSHQLCGKGEDGKENVLVPFSKYSQKIEYGMKMSARQPLGQRPIITQNCSKC